MQQAVAAHGEGLTLAHDHGAVGQRVDVAPVRALGFAVEPFGVQDFVHRRRARALGLAGEQRGETLGILAPAFEAGPVAGGQRRHLVEEEQFGVAVAPDLAMAVVEIEPAADPLLRRPAPRRELALVVVNAPAAIAQQRAARGRGDEFAERRRRGFAAAWHLIAVMPGLVPGDRSGWHGFAQEYQMAGTSPAMTTGRLS